MVILSCHLHLGRALEAHSHHYLWFLKLFLRKIMVLRLKHTLLKHIMVSLCNQGPLGLVLLPQNDGVMVGNGRHLQVTHTGKEILPTPLAAFHLSHVLHTPHITHNLIFVNQFARDNNCSLIFYSLGLKIQDKNTHTILYQGPCHKGLYPILNFSEKSSVASLALATTSSSVSLWCKLHRPSSLLVDNSMTQHTFACIPFIVLYFLISLF